MTACKHASLQRACVHKHILPPRSNQGTEASSQLFASGPQTSVFCCKCKLFVSVYLVQFFLFRLRFFTLKLSLTHEVLSLFFSFLGFSLGKITQLLFQLLFFIISFSVSLKHCKEETSHFCLKPAGRSFFLAFTAPSAPPSVLHQL